MGPLASASRITAIVVAAAVSTAIAAQIRPVAIAYAGDRPTSQNAPAVTPAATSTKTSTISNTLTRTSVFATGRSC